MVKPIKITPISTTYALASTSSVLGVVLCAAFLAAVNFPHDVGTGEADLRPAPDGSTGVFSGSESKSSLADFSTLMFALEAADPGRPLDAGKIIKSLIIST